MVILKSWVFQIFQDGPHFLKSSPLPGVRFLILGERFCTVYTNVLDKSIGIILLNLACGAKGADNRVGTRQLCGPKWCTISGSVVNGAM